MPNHFLLDGDLVNFETKFNEAFVEARQGKLQGSGYSLNGKKICLEGDEKNVEIAGCKYTTADLLVRGEGTLKIKSLGADQISADIETAGGKVLLQGSYFEAVFEVTSPAMRHGVSGKHTPDSVAFYYGRGFFAPGS